MSAIEYTAIAGAAAATLTVLARIHAMMLRVTRALDKLELHETRLAAVESRHLHCSIHCPTAQGIDQ